MQTIEQEPNLQHPLAINKNNHAQNDEFLAVCDEQENEPTQTKIKSPNSRRRRRGSRRHSSATTSYSIPDEQDMSRLPTLSNSTVQSASLDNCSFLTDQYNKKQHTNHHGRRKSSACLTSLSASKFTPQNSKHHNQSLQESSPAFQSLVDIISEMKRLPSISITPDNNESTNQDGSISTNAEWKRVRRHSEPPHKFNLPKLNKTTHSPMNMEEHTTFHYKPVFTNSFLPLQEEVTDDNTQTSSKRTRSKSVPNTFSSISTLPTRHDSFTRNGKKLLFPAHLEISEASTLICTNKLFSGILHVNQGDSSDAYVECEVLNESIYIFGSRNRNRAFNGDEVAVALVDVDNMLHEKITKKKARQARRLSAFSLGGEATSLSSIPESSILEQASSLPDNVLLAQDESIQRRPKYCGRVVCILERTKNMLFSGTLSLNRPHANTLDNSSRERKEPHAPKIIWFVPADKRLPLVAVPIKYAPVNFIKYHEEYKNRIFVGSIQRWPVSSLHPFGIIEKEIGWTGELAVHSGALMADHHIKDYELCPSVVKDIYTTQLFTDADKKERRDLTDENVFCCDLEDKQYAFSLSKEKGIFEIGVHVTDIGHYVRYGTPLDREARERSCLVKLVDKKIPILPSEFIHTYCSLEKDIERLAFSVMCRFTENGILLHAWIGQTVVKVKGYVDVNHMRQDDDTLDPIEEDAKTILEICQKLQNMRLHKLNGFNLARQSEVFELAESGYPEEIDLTQQADEDLLFQELLIIANFEVAQKVCSRFPDQALLCKQDRIKLSSLDALQCYFDATTDNTTFNTVQDVFKATSSVVDEDKHAAILHVLDQCIPKSKYFSAGSLDISKYHHAASGASVYTVFTEPITNYASIFVQRQLCLALKGEEQENDKFDMTDKIARHCNSAQLYKMAAEQASRKLYTAAYIYRALLNTDTEEKGVCSEGAKKVMELKAVVVGFEDNDNETVKVYVPQFDLELKASRLEEVCDLQSGNFGLNHKKTKLEYMSVVYINVGVDMKMIKPLFHVEIADKQ